MENTLISFETAILAKEKGFNEVCLDNYGLDGNLYVRQPIELSPNNSMWNHVISAPTQSKLQKWLRVHNIDITVYPVEMKTETRSVFQEIKDKEYEYYISIGGVQQFDTVKIFTTYEEALEQGLLAALKLIKEKYEK